MSLPNLSNLTAVIKSLRHSMLSFEDQLSCMESTNQAHIVTISMMPRSPPPTSTHGKGEAKATPASMKAKLAKREHPTKKSTMPSDALPSISHKHSLRRENPTITSSPWPYWMQLQLMLSGMGAKG
jgi:hypothetical protein